MPGLVPGIHVLQCFDKEDVDGRDKPGHDEQTTEARQQFEPVFEAVSTIVLPRLRRWFRPVVNRKD